MLRSVTLSRFSMRWDGPVGAQVKQGRGWSVSLLFCGATYYVRRANLLTFTRERVREALTAREEAAQA